MAGFIEPTVFDWDDTNGKRVKKAAKGTKWRARYRDTSNRARSKTFDRKTDAEKFLHINATDMARGDWTDPKLRRQRFDQWIDAWWATTSGLAPSTRRGYYLILKLHVIPFFGGRSIIDIDYLDVEEFIAWMRKRGVSPKKIRDSVSVCSLIFKTAMRAKLRRDNPAADHSIPKRSKKIGQGDVLDMVQARNLIEHVRDPYKPAVWVLILCGLRPAELCGLRVRNVDLVRGRLRVEETRQPIYRFGDDRFGNEPYQMAVGPPKTDAGDRVIPIDAELVADIAEVLAERTRAGGGPLDPDSPLFVGARGGPLHRDKFRSHVMRPALRAAGLPETIRTYDLRHSHASLLIDRGANPLAVAQRMGHTDPTVTLKVYGHLFEGVQEDLTEKLRELRHEELKSNIVELPKRRRKQA